MASYQKLSCDLEADALAVGVLSVQRLRVTLPLVGPQGPAGPQGQDGASAWDDISGKPEVFPPSTHASSHAAGGNDPLFNFDGRKIITVSKRDTATNTRAGIGKYDAERPFATITAAQNAAASGDVIVVEPGTYNEADLGKDGLSYYFHPNTIVDATANGSEYGVFTDGDEARVFSVFGHARLVDDNGGRGVGVIVTNAGSRIYVEVDSIFVRGGDLTTGLYCGGGEGTIRVAKSVVCEGYDAVIILEGKWAIEANEIATVGDDGNAIEIAGGEAHIRASQIRGDGTTNNNASSATIAIAGGGEATIDCPRIVSSSDNVIGVSGNANGEVTLYSSELVAESASREVVKFNSPNSAKINLVGCNIVAGNSAEYAATGTGAIYANTLRSNKPLASTITFTTHTHPTTDITGLGTAATAAATDFLPTAAPTSATLAVNGTLAIEATSNTLLTLRYRGSDGVTRSVAFPIS